MVVLLDGDGTLATLALLKSKGVLLVMEPSLGGDEAFVLSRRFGELHKFQERERVQKRFGRGGGQGGNRFGRGGGGGRLGRGGGGGGGGRSQRWGTGSGGNLAYSVGHRVTNVLDPLRICGLIRHVNDQVFPPAVGDLCWELCLPVGENRDHAYSNPTMGDGLEILGALKWKVMVCGGGGDPMIDRQRNVAKLMKETGLNVVERFTDGDVHGAELGDPSKSETLFASIKSFISSTPYRF
ncbi:hypothetical protein Bca4012_053062 [Brassica carinata]|uniref:Alpha/beta hydrolase fold-3 domain-containing protein n=1 Tax=Brassica carinata TaxID=52824 RepID=A0A8X7RB09_BRACI|nr:hypothetical protein Bca52824_055602 [Brassica carinata]